MTEEATITETEKQDAKAMLKERFGNVTRIGGKGRLARFV